MTLRDAGDHRAASRCRFRLRVIVAGAICAVVITACGASGQTSSGPTDRGREADALAYAKCIRSHGVPNLPDPKVAGGGIQLSLSGSGINPGSPALQSAQKLCRHLLPGGGPGAGPRSAQAHARLLEISTCMRRNGVSSFPDPQSGSPPSSPAGYSAIIGLGGYFLAIPSSVDMSSPAFEQAATACKFGNVRVAK